MTRILGIKFWDVQHGNATHITTPNNRAIVIDLGDGDSIAGGSRFSPLNFLRFNQGVGRIDYLIITHPHRDHIDDIENVAGLDPIALQRPGWLTDEEVRQGNKQEDSSKVSQYLALSARFTGGLTRPNDPRIAEDWGGAQIRTYISPGVPTTNLNNHSIVTLITFAGSTALLPGDNESPSWTELLKDPVFRSELPKVDLLLAPHHGRDAGFCSDLFDAGLNPFITVISDDQHGSTSVTGKYGAKTKGWTVHSADGSSETRKCITTRYDKNIYVQFWTDDSGQNGMFVRIGV